MSTEVKTEEVVTTEAKSGKGIKRMSLTEFGSMYIDALAADEDMDGLIARYVAKFPTEKEKKKEEREGYISAKIQQFRDHYKDMGLKLDPLKRRERKVDGENANGQSNKALLNGELLERLKALGKVRAIAPAENKEESGATTETQTLTQEDVSTVEAEGIVVPEPLQEEVTAPVAEQEGSQEAKLEAPKTGKGKNGKAK